MEGFVAILICAIMAAGGLLTASGLNKSRQLATTRHTRAALLAAVVFFAMLGGFAVVTALVLVAAWVVTWW